MPIDGDLVFHFGQTLGFMIEQLNKNQWIVG